MGLRFPNLDEPGISRQFPTYDLEFARVELSRGIDYYDARTRAMGLTGRDRVLDAACGVGQWSLAFSAYNRAVVGADRREQRVGLAQRLIDANPGTRNVHLSVADLHQLPFEDRSFDAVFCYGVLMFLNERRALAEMARVLRSDGLIYICANGFGWSLYFLWHRSILRRDPIAFAYGCKAVIDTLIQKRLLRRNPPTNTFLTRSEISGIMRDHGLVPTYVGGEGTFRVDGAPSFTPVYRSRYLGFDCVLEWVGHKGVDPG